MYSAICMTTTQAPFYFIKKCNLNLLNKIYNKIILITHIKKNKTKKHKKRDICEVPNLENFLKMLAGLFKFYKDDEVTSPAFFIHQM